MNIAVIILILMALGGAGAVARKNGGPNRSGRIVFDGMWSYYNKLKVVDYDYYCKIEGFNKSTGEPMVIASPKGYQNWQNKNKYDRNGWSFSKSPDLAFKDAWKNYLNAGGESYLNWTTVYTPYFWNRADKEKARNNMLGWIKFFFPNLQSLILDSIPQDLQDTIEIVVEGGAPSGNQ